MTSLLDQFTALPTITHLLIGGILVIHFVIAPRLGMWAFSLFALPGTAVHELSHWLVALLLGAKPSFPNIIPKREGSTWKLGSVRMTPNILTRIPIALAPIALLPFGIWYAVAHPEVTAGWDLVHVWIAGTLIAASLPSRQDWWVALPALICAIVGYLGILQLQIN